MMISQMSVFSRIRAITCRLISMSKLTKQLCVTAFMCISSSMINCDCMCHVLNHIAKCNKLNDENLNLGITIIVWHLLSNLQICTKVIKITANSLSNHNINGDQGFEQTILMVKLNADFCEWGVLNEPISMSTPTKHV